MKPIISTIIPVYNAEKYLRETIESVIAQSTGFADTIELLLVDDGSSDGSALICKEYVDRYPENIIYIHQDNSGVSAARNTGLLKANGEYVHFLDADDLISRDTYKSATAFLQQHRERIDFVAFKIKFFDADIATHPNNYKFSKKRIIDIGKEPDNPIQHSPSCVFLKTALDGLFFDTKLAISEDAKFISDVLIRKRAYGVITDATLHYRKREDGTSTIGGQYRRKDFYLVTPKRFYEYFIEQWTGTDGILARFAQYELIYDISWRIMQSSQDVLTPQEQNKYILSIKHVLAHIEDEAIATKRNLSIHTLATILHVKYGAKWRGHITVHDGYYYFKTFKLYPVAMERVHLDFIHYIGNGELRVEGYSTTGDLDNHSSLFIEYGNNITEVKKVTRVHRERGFFGDISYQGGAFEVSIPVSSGQKIAFVRSNGVDLRQPIPIRPNQYSGLSSLPFTYCRKGEFILRMERYVLGVYDTSLWRLVWFETIYVCSILLSWRLKRAYEQYRKLRDRNLSHLTKKDLIFEISKPLLIIADTVIRIPRALALRACYFILKPHMRKSIWLISDRGMAAGDNGEALFRYIQTRRDCKANVFFAISKKSSDYDRIKRVGKVVSHGSIKYKLLFLLSDKIISSHADIETTNPFIRQLDHYVDLLHFDFVFLQHGIIRHDLSAWLNRYEKNISLFITSAQMEYDSILSMPYYYRPENVALTGLARYDLLQNKPDRKLILAPTYRKELIHTKTDKTGARGYDHKFKDSTYFHFYNNFINDERIISALESNGMVGELYLHPNLAAQAKDFTSNENFSLADFPYDYTTAFKEGELLVSDYSSVVFDFAFLKKPVIYAQYDACTFFGGQGYSRLNHFSDAKNGFGPVTADYEALVSAVLDAIGEGCVMEEKYRARVDDFFRWHDRCNSQRIYEAISKNETLSSRASD